MGSFAITEDARREAVGSALTVVDGLLTFLSPASKVGDETAGGVAVENCTSAKGAHRSPTIGKQGRSKRRKKGLKAAVVVDDKKAEAKAGGDRAGEDLPWGSQGEAVVARAYALEAAVGLCCLLPAARGADGEDDGIACGGIIARLVEWHER